MRITCSAAEFLQVLGVVLHTSAWWPPCMDHAAILCSARLQKGRISPCSLQPQRRPPVHLATSQRSLATAGRDPLALALGADLDLETTSAGHEAEAEVREVRVSPGHTRSHAIGTLTGHRCCKLTPSASVGSSFRYKKNRDRPKLSILGKLCRKGIAA